MHVITNNITNAIFINFNLFFLAVNITKLDVACQTVIYRKRKIAKKIYFRSKQTQTKNPTTVSNSTSPIKVSTKSVFTNTSDANEHDSDASVSIKNDSDSCYTASDSEEEDSLSDYSPFNIESLILTRRHIEENPVLYLGVPKGHTYILNLLAKKLSHHSKILTPKDQVCLVLKKLRWDLPFSLLSREFGISLSQCSRMFSKNLKVIATHMNELILWPNAIKILQNLPVSFRRRFQRVESIIDCFEIEIEKPSNPVHQALTWSDYKKCNTVKYLISMIPSGLVNFISKGYGGRCSDQNITKNCGYLENLKPNTQVMADRGFKHLESLIQLKNCKLVKPPSVKSGEQLTAEEAKFAKTVAALRVHVERLIRRLREYRFLDPHACTNNHLIACLDDAVITACGLINLQGHLIG